MIRLSIDLRGFSTDKLVALNNKIVCLKNMKKKSKKGEEMVNNEGRNRKKK